MIFQAMLAVVLASNVEARAAAPKCDAEVGRKAEHIVGSVKRGNMFTELTPTGWIVKLAPVPEGWFLIVTMKGRESEDLARLTPPWHFMPNPREIEGWHFRNLDNTAPNDGSVNAPQEFREFIFSPAVGREIEYDGNATTPESVEKVRSFGRGWPFIKSYRLTGPERGQRAAFESIDFSVCLTWPSNGALERTGRQATNDGRGLPAPGRSTPGR